MIKDVKLMTADEMQDRHQRQEDPFGLVLDKWSRIQSFLGSAFSQEDFVTILEAAQIPIPFCLDLESRNACSLCPIIRVCQSPKDGLESLWSGVFRLLQAYAWAGDFLNPEPLKNMVAELIAHIRDARESYRK
jgi:hypothetical protein